METCEVLDAGLQEQFDDNHGQDTDEPIEEPATRTDTAETEDPTEEAVLRRVLAQRQAPADVPPPQVPPVVVVSDAHVGEQSAEPQPLLQDIAEQPVAAVPPIAGTLLQKLQAKGSGPRDPACGNVRLHGLGMVRQYLDRPAELFNVSEVLARIVYLYGVARNAGHEKTTEFCAILHELEKRKPLFSGGLSGHYGRAFGGPRPSNNSETDHGSAQVPSQDS
ncbi:Hypothetical predicted protein [Paramuricea clavata]|uniref:Uncharacterized protein n=1 Tax=Paramuricea clavata TaxID=317549 RepID=A0A7D9J5G3_PARCT|nr:Hypothetical predicted protein [Paramuricea clavata]